MKRTLGSGVVTRCFLHSDPNHILFMFDVVQEQRRIAPFIAFAQLAAKEALEDAKWTAETHEKAIRTVSFTARLPSPKWWYQGLFALIRPNVCGILGPSSRRISAFTIFHPPPINSHGSWTYFFVKLFTSFSFHFSGFCDCRYFNLVYFLASYTSCGFAQSQTVKERRSLTAHLIV